MSLLSEYSCDRTTSREGGQVVPLMALILVGLMTIAAFAIDLGGQRQTRAQFQSAADAAVLFAAQDLPTESLAVTDIQTTMQQNLGFAPDLNSCTGSNADPNALSNPASGASCVSFDNGATSVRVYYRGTYKTAIAKVIGVNSLAVNRGATASKTAVTGFGGVLPFGIPSGSGTGEVCLKTASGGGAIGPCKSVSGNFHYLDVAQYGNTTLGTSARCLTKDHDPLLRDNTAMGIDHPLTNYAGSPIADAYIACDYNAGPNELATETGNIDSLLTGPLLTDTTASTCAPAKSPCETDKGGARLLRGSFKCTASNSWSGWSDKPKGTAYTCGTVEGLSGFDDAPLWHFIGKTGVTGDVSGGHAVDSAGKGLLADVPDACQYPTFTDQLAKESSGVAQRAEDMRKLLDGCFTAYSKVNKSGTTPGCTNNPCQGKIFGFQTAGGLCGSKFEYDIQCSPRFGYAPVVCATFSLSTAPYTPCKTIYPSGSSGNVLIESRQPIYIQRVTDNQAADLETNDANNSLDFEPGVQYSSPGTKDSVVNMIAFAFDRAMLPGSLGDADAPNETDVNLFVRLVK